MTRICSLLINIIVATVALSLTACGGGSSGGSDGTGTLSLSVTDAPVLDEDIAEVWVRFTHVIIHSDGGDDTPQPVTDGTNPWIDVNLKDLTQGKTMLLGEFELPAGHYSWIRLDIDPENTVIVEREVVGLPDGEGNSETDDMLFASAKLDCSSCDESHLKLNRSFTIENGGWQNFTIDFDLQKSLTLQLPQSEKRRDDYAYKLRPTLRILDVELAGTFIWGTVTDTRVTKEDFNDPTVCEIYVYSGDETTVIPDDLCVPDYVGDTHCDAVNNQRPLTTADVINNSGTFEYRTGPLYPGMYTVVMRCPDSAVALNNADDPYTDDDLIYIGEQGVDATLDPPDGLGSEANFLLAD